MFVARGAGVPYNAFEAKEEVSPVFIFALPRTTE
jgi:hypothetical protein